MPSSSPHNANEEGNMAFKPFKPPSSKKLSSVPPNVPLRLEDSPHILAREEPPLKRRKLSPEATFTPPSETPTELRAKPVSALNSVHVSRAPLRSIENAVSPDSVAIESKPCEEHYYSVLWRKFTQKKNKTWDDDGYVSVRASQATLYDSNGRRLGQSPCPLGASVGTTISIAGKDVEINEEIKKQEFAAIVKVPIDNGSHSSRDTQSGGRAVPFVETTKPKQTLREQMRQEMKKATVANPSETNRPVQRLPSKVPFKQPLKDNNVLPQTSSETPIPRHDPTTPGVVVFRRPSEAPPGQQIVDVVLDPILGKHLRDHQRDGVKFLYECVMGLRKFGGQGCILADDMGLGKTLQTIALLWTLIKQNPIHRAEPVVKKALIVCPVSLIQNWKKEFRKWLGRDRLGVLAFEDKGSRLSMFDGKNFKVMIVGYERLRTIAEDLTRGAGIDIVICDEGHRLKTLQNKSAKAIEYLNTSKRIILSGTPIQNDLSEFFAMANFVNDGVLGSYKAFMKDFEGPIVKSQQPNATKNDLEKGEYASEELANITSPFILRRTADILFKYLPPKTEYVLFCDPTPEQRSIYRHVVQSPMFQNALGSSETALQLITILKKLCNSPALMRPDRGNDESTSSNSLTVLNEMLPAGISRLYNNRFATKIRLLDELLHRIRTTTDDKVILVSNYTSTLNLMAQLLDNSGGRYLRLDGSVPQGKRQGLVDEFNKSPPSAYFAFLLSAKAGGVGLNLIGASRLILFDVDWNPATDDQAMARIHREGQTKHCRIYRFLIKGGLEERIWQRQVVKRGLAQSILDSGNSHNQSADTLVTGKKGKAAFSRDELRDLFRLDESQGLRTHELLSCGCKGDGTKSFSISKVYLESESSDLEPSVIGLPEPASFVKASDLQNTITGTEACQSTRVKKLEDQELMQYLHLDTSKIPDLHNSSDTEKLQAVQRLIDDDCLAEVLKLDNDVIAGRIAYVFKKTSSMLGES